MPIAQALHQAEQGTAVAELCRKLGVSETVFYHWKKKSQTGALKRRTAGHRAERLGATV